MSLYRFPLGRCQIRYQNSGFAAWASPRGRSAVLNFLQNAFFAVLIAFCTKPMRWFGRLCLWFQDIGESSRTNGLQLLALSLSFPCFEISHLFFKLTYLLQKRRALILSRKRAIVGFNDLGLEFDHFTLKRGGIPHAYHCLRNVIRSSERSNSGSDSTHIRHDAPPS